MCILSFSDSFVMVIGDQMGVRRPVCALSVLTLWAVTVVFLVMNSVCNIHFRINNAMTMLNNFSHLNGVALLVFGKLHGCIDRFLHVLGSMSWCGVSLLSAVFSQWNIPMPRFWMAA